MTVPLILSLDSNGTPASWISWQTAVCYEAKEMVAWKMGEVTFTFHGGKNRMTGQQSTITTASIIAVKGKKGKSEKWYAKAPALSNKSLFRRDQHVCAYCGTEFGHDHLTRDHIMPTSRNGKDNWMNVVSACIACNHRKANKTPEEAGMELLYVPYTPSRMEHLIMQNRKVLYDQMEYLRGFLPKHSRLLNEVVQ